MSLPVERMTIKTSKSEPLNLSIMSGKTDPSPRQSRSNLDDYLAMLLYLATDNSNAINLVVTPEFALHFEVSSHSPIVTALSHVYRNEHVLITSALDTISNAVMLLIFQDGKHKIIKKGDTSMNRQKILSIDGIQVGVEHCFENQISNFRLPQSSVDLLVVPAHKLICDELLAFDRISKFRYPNLKSVSDYGHALLVDGYYTGANNGSYISLTQKTPEGPKPLFHNASS